MLNRRLFFSALSFYAGLILWLGGLAMFGIAVAPIIFKTLPSKDLAGALNAVILHRLNMLELAGATLVGISLALDFIQENVSPKPDKTLLTAIGILIGMLLVWSMYALVITAEMNALRTEINSFDAPNTASMALVQTFRAYHQWYSRLVGTNLLAGLSLLGLQTWRFSKKG